jgi:glucan 1,3-beta-glucosidase
MVSATLQIDYYTQLVGDPSGSQLPTIKCSSDFRAGYVIDADPYYHGSLLWDPTSNFFREIRNLRIDMTSINPSINSNGINWPVGQATNLQNLVFEMSTAEGTQQ